MAMAPLPPTKLLTYEDYMTEGEVNLRYDIIDGVRIVTNPTRRHQDAQGVIYEEFRAYQRATRNGRTYQAPCDVLITRIPLRTRQPDVLFISNARLALNPPSDDPEPLSPAPELVVEILSPSDTVRVLADKLRDYGRVGVQECWGVHSGSQSVEVLEWDGQGWQTVATYGTGEVVSSVSFPDLTVSVDAIFAE